MGFAEDFRLGLQRLCCLPALCARRVQWGTCRNGHLEPFSRGPTRTPTFSRVPHVMLDLLEIHLAWISRKIRFFSIPPWCKQEEYFIKIVWILPLLFLVHKILGQTSQWLPQAAQDSFASPPVCCPAHRSPHIHANTNSCEFLGMTPASHAVIRSVLSLQHLRRNLFVFLDTSVQSSVLDNVLWC